MVFKIFSIIITVLFCWVIYPYKWIRKATFEARKLDAIRDCQDMAAKYGRRFYVVQNRLRFYVKDRSTFGSWNLKNNRKMQHALNFDYRNSIIYHCGAHGESKHYERVSKK